MVAGGKSRVDPESGIHAASRVIIGSAMAQKKESYFLELIQLLHLLLYTFLNPVIFLVYLFTFSEERFMRNCWVRPVYQTGTNSMRINLMAYLLFSLLAVASFVLFKQLVLAPLMDRDVFWLEFALIEPTPMHWVAYGCCLLVLGYYSSPKGLEANVAGFIFFPFLLVGALLMTILHLYWLWREVI